MKFAGGGVELLWLADAQDPDVWVAIALNKQVGGREAWMGFRELARPKWAQAFRTEVERATGATTFTYVTAVTRLTAQADRAAWEQHAVFSQNLGGNPIRILTFDDMLSELFPTINQTVASSQLGRLLQLIKASGWALTSRVEGPNLI